MQFHFAQLPKQYEAFSIKGSLYQDGAIGVGPVKQNSGTACMSESEGILEGQKQAKVKSGQSVELDDNDLMTVRVLPKSEQPSQGGHKIDGSSYVVVIDDFEFAWKKDFYEMYIKDRKPLQLVLELFGRPKGSNDAVGPIGFAMLEINNPQDGKIAYGYFVVAVNELPVTFNRDNYREKPLTFVGFSILDLANYKKPLKQQVEEERNRVDTPQSQKQFIPNDEK